MIRVKLSNELFVWTGVVMAAFFVFVGICLMAGCAVPCTYHGKLISREDAQRILDMKAEAERRGMTDLAETLDVQCGGK